MKFLQLNASKLGFFCESCVPGLAHDQLNQNAGREAHA